MRWTPRLIIARRAGTTGASRFAWTKQRPQPSMDVGSTRRRYRCTGRCGQRFRSVEPVRACRQCGGAVQELSA